MRMGAPYPVRVIDSHTEGEPTRVVVEGTPVLRSTTMAERVEELRKEHDGLRSGIICEPRGHDAIVGAYLFAPTSSEADLGVIFFNNARYLGMCGHGTIGLLATLAYQGKLNSGEVRLETPAGLVRARLHEDGSVTVWNVRSFRHWKDVSVPIEGYGTVVGDVAFGGNWFFLVQGAPVPLNLAHLDELNRFTASIRRALAAQGITGASGAEIDHVEVFDTPQLPGSNSRNFVLCPGLAYDRSPCGTGLSAKLACLAGDGKLAPGEIWRQESVLGTVFEGAYEAAEPEGVWPSVRGRAWVTGETTFVFDPQDPFQEGIVS